MDTGIVIAIIAAAATVIAAGITTISNGFGWQTSVLRDIEVFEKLYPLVDKGREEVNLEIFRARIFRRLEKGISKRSTNIRRFLLFGLVYFILMIAQYFVTGKEINAERVAYSFVCAIIYGAVITGIAKLMEYHPARKWNPIYVQAQRLRDAEKIFDDFFATIEQEHRAEGWVSNFYLYEQSKKAEWGYRDSADRDDGGKEQVDRGEDDEKGSDVLHDDLQGERDADDGNATGGVGKDG